MSRAGHVRQRSAGSYEIRWRLPDGRTATRTVRGGRRDAERALRGELHAIDRGEAVASSKLKVGAHLAARIEQWQASGKIAARTAEHYRTVAVEIVRHIGDVPLQKLSTVDVEQMHTAMRAKGLTRTANAAHALLQRALADAVKHKLIRANVAREQGAPPTVDAPPMVTLNAEQVPELLAKLEGDPWRVPVIVALYCGLRRGEQLALRWHHVDLDARVLRIREALDETKALGVRVKAPKSAAGARDITLPQIVVDALREHRRGQLERALLLGTGRPPDDALVFPAPDGGYDGPRAFSLRWGRAAGRLGLPRVTWHALRHTHASMLIAAGVPITTVAARLGHADAAVTLRVYAHLFTASDAAAAQAIDKALGQ